MNFWQRSTQKNRQKYNQCIALILTKEILKLGHADGREVIMGLQCLSPTSDLCCQKQAKNSLKINDQVPPTSPTTNTTLMVTKKVSECLKSKLHFSYFINKEHFTPWHEGFKWCFQTSTSPVDKLWQGDFWNLSSWHKCWHKSGEIESENGTSACKIPHYT